MLDKLFRWAKKKDSPEAVAPPITFGRYSDNNKTLLKTKRWADADNLFKENKHHESIEAFFDYLETALIWLDSHDEVANFHLILLLGMTRFLGFYPDTAQQEAPFFELTEGVFTQYHGVSCLSEHETGLFKKLLSLKLTGDTKCFVAAERKALLAVLMDYYAFHLDGFRRPKSLEVLGEVFSS